MEKKKTLFNLIAPVYALFYHMQKKNFSKAINEARDKLDISKFKSIIDIGCGTGALCSVLNEQGMLVTGIDPAINMLKIAMNKPENINVSFISANVLEKLPFDDKSFDISIASYVAHGLEAGDRKQMYAEMSRISKHWVVIHDYNDRRSLFTTIIEWLEGGDYFNFIKNAVAEMNDCIMEGKTCFSEVRTVNVGFKAAWYICKPTLID